MTSATFPESLISLLSAKYRASLKGLSISEIVWQSAASSPANWPITEDLSSILATKDKHFSEAFLKIWGISRTSILPLLCGRRRWMAPSLWTSYLDGPSPRLHPFPPPNHHQTVSRRVWERGDSSFRMHAPRWGQSRRCHLSPGLRGRNYTGRGPTGFNTGKLKYSICHTKIRKRSINQHIKYFNFRSKVQLDHPVHF